MRTQEMCEEKQGRCMHQRQVQGLREYSCCLAAINSRNRGVIQTPEEDKCRLEEAKPMEARASQDKRDNTDTICPSEQRGSSEHVWAAMLNRSAVESANRQRVSCPAAG